MLIELEYAHKNQPVPTQNLQVVRPDYKNIEEMYKNEVFIKSEIVGNGPKAKTVNYYEDQKTLKYTDWDNKISYSKPIVIRAYTDEIKTKVDANYEKKCKVDSKVTGSGENEKQIDSYQDRKITRYYDMRKKEFVENVEVVRSYNEEKAARVKEELKTEVSETRVSQMKTKKGKIRVERFFRRDIIQVIDYYLVTTKTMTYKC